jgi:hypothetical protein
MKMSLVTSVLQQEFFNGLLKETQTVSMISCLMTYGLSGNPALELSAGHVRLVRLPQGLVDCPTALGKAIPILDEVLKVFGSIGTRVCHPNAKNFFGPAKVHLCCSAWLRFPLEHVLAKCADQAIS